jgi:tetratricopeptide (TPR) repeat protein
MNKILTLLAAAILIVGCSSAPPPKQPAVLDFGDQTSQTLTTNAWLALADGNYDHAIKYTERCVELYEKEARKMQASMSAKADFDDVHDYWALNDVGTSYFIMGEALAKSGKKAEAIAAYKVVKNDLKYAQTWDPKGWFWSPSDAAWQKIIVLSEDF